MCLYISYLANKILATGSLDIEITQISTQVVKTQYMYCIEKHFMPLLE